MPHESRTPGQSSLCAAARSPHAPVPDGGGVGASAAALLHPPVFPCGLPVPRRLHPRAGDGPAGGGGVHRDLGHAPTPGGPGAPDLRADRSDAALQPSPVCLRGPVLLGGPHRLLDGEHLFLRVLYPALLPARFPAPGCHPNLFGRCLCPAGAASGLGHPPPAGLLAHLRPHPALASARLSGRGGAGLVCHAGHLCRLGRPAAVQPGRPTGPQRRRPHHPGNLACVPGVDLANPPPLPLPAVHPAHLGRVPPGATQPPGLVPLGGNPGRRAIQPRYGKRCPPNGLLHRRTPQLHRTGHAGGVRLPARHHVFAGRGIPGLLLPGLDGGGTQFHR